MDWLKRMADAVDCIEAHMEEPFDATAIARAACSSVFHFQRMFHMLTGCTVADYVRRRRLTLAAQELAAAKAKVLDVALKYGYDTPESFAKAFRRVHGISPSAARKPGANLKAYPRLSFHLSLKGDEDMDYRIVERDAFQVVGKVKRFCTKDGEHLRRIPEFWGECDQNGTWDRLGPYADGRASLGICLEMEYGKEHFTYMIGVESEAAPRGSEFAARIIPASTWAVFTSIGPLPGAIQELTSRIYREWFPATGYEHAGTAEMEVYPAGDTQAADYCCEVWVPIKKK